MNHVRTLRERLSQALRWRIALSLGWRKDTCWPEVATFALVDGHTWTELWDTLPWSRWYTGVATCRRDARLHGACWCGKFCTQAWLNEMGGGPEASNIVVTSEVTGEDRYHRPLFDFTGAAE